MLNKLIKKHIKSRNKQYSQPVEYDISIKSYSVTVFKEKPNANNLAEKLECAKKISINKNQVIQLINDFYHDTHSLKNSHIGYRVIFILGGLLYIFAALLIYLKMINSQNKLWGYLFNFITVIFAFFLKFISNNNKNNIIKKQSHIFQTDFKNINEVQLYWLRNRIGNDITLLELSERLLKWKSHKEKYVKTDKIYWLTHFYDPNSKPRILALVIFIFSLTALILLNVFEVDSFSVLINFALIKHIVFEQTWLAIFIIFLIFTLFCGAVMTMHFLRTVFMYIFDLFGRYKVISEVKFSFLINFLLDNVDITK